MKGKNYLKSMERRPDRAQYDHLATNKEAESVRFEAALDEEGARDEAKVAAERREAGAHDHKAIAHSIGNVIAELAPLFPSSAETPNDVYLDKFDKHDTGDGDDMGIYDRDPAKASPRTTELKNLEGGGIGLSSPSHKETYPIHPDVNAKKQYGQGHTSVEREAIDHTQQLQDLLTRWTRAAKSGDVLSLPSELLRSGEHAEIQRGEKPEDLSIISGSWKDLRAA